MINVPSGDAFLFLLNGKHHLLFSVMIASLSYWEIVPSYTLALINTAVTIGLLTLYMPAYQVWNWSPPFHAPRWAVVFYLFANLFLVSVPFVPPSPGTKLYVHLPYWVSSSSSIDYEITN